MSFPAWSRPGEHETARSSSRSASGRDDARYLSRQIGARNLETLWQAQIADGQKRLEDERARSEALLKEERRKNEALLKEEQSKNEALIKEEQSKNDVVFPLLFFYQNEVLTKAQPHSRRCLSQAQGCDCQNASQILRTVGAGERPAREGSQGQGPLLQRLILWNGVQQAE